MITNFHLTVLGSSSATPTSERNPSGQFLNFYDRYFLIDCGEGTQSQIRKFKLKLNRIQHIFISHLHGDHYFGLPGLLSSLHLLNQTQSVNIYCHKELKNLLEQIFTYSDTYLKFPLHFHFLNPEKEELVYEDDKITVSSFPLKHRVKCNGFLFNEKPGLLSIRKEMISMLNLSPHDIIKIKKGNDYIDSDGNVIKNSMLVHPPRPLISYAYCSDTVYDESLVKYIENVTLLYHEATFCSDQEKRAQETYHSTASQAANIAKKSRANQLMIGHFSSRYRQLDGFLTEAQEIFKNTILAEEGNTYSL